MSTHKHIDTICLVAALLALVLCAVFMNGEALGIRAASKVMGYEDRLFDTSKVHTIDIIIDDWDRFLETARSEEYSVCSVVIDGEAVNNVGIRGKGNTSLSSVASMDSDRYSFKIEFDQYDSTKTYHSLDKLCLNNVIQDNTYMKDYLTYQMMNEFGVPAPLCSYAYITVNGEDWGLYLAVEAVEESFLQRNYGSNFGDLYKPDSMNMGGGRGNGKDFEMPDSTQQQDSGSETMQKPMRAVAGSGGMQMPDMGGGFGGMGSSQTKLQYIDDDPASYSTIFESAKTNVTDADQARLIASLKQLSEYENLEEVLNIEDVLRYFVVHNYVVNGDSYTGSMIHNYYLYEKNGQLSMIPWDYNLAFGTFMGGNGFSSVNDDIDEVLSDRPMQAWIFSDETYSQQYYALYAELLEQVDVQGIIDNAYRLIAPYVEEDPTAFCTYEEFQIGAETLKEFCALRSESVWLQLSGSTETIDAGTLDLSAMGTMGGGMGGFGDRGDFGNRDNSDSDAEPQQGGMRFSDGMQLPEGMQMPEDVRFPGNTGMTKTENDQSSESPEATGYTPPNGFGDFGNFFPSGEMPDFGNMGGFNSMTNNGQGVTANTSTVVLLAVSVLFLAVGSFIAFKFRR